MVEVPVWHSQSFLKPKVAPNCSAAVWWGLFFPDEVFTVSVLLKGFGRGSGVGKCSHSIKKSFKNEFARGKSVVC